MAAPTPAPLVSAARPASIQELARSLRAVHASGRDGAAFRRIYQVTSGDAACAVPPQLAAKYSLAEDNVQRVISVTNRVTHDQAWWNPSRSSKPQTFKRSAVSPSDLDSTGGGARCDFCAWSTLTASDNGFGRVELRHAVTGSNLFKYAEPSHGVVLFRHHDPLAFDFDQLSDLVDASWLWFERSARAHERRAQGANGGARQQQGEPLAGGEEEGEEEEWDGRLWPFLLWNCLPRAGASQYHGHAQVALTRAPLPQQAQLAAAAARYADAHGGKRAGGGSGGGMGRVFDSAASLAAAGGGSKGNGDAGDSGPACFYSDLLRAHRAAGLLRQVSLAAGSGSGGGEGSVAWEGQAWGFASLAPRKDCEVFVLGSHLGCPAFKAMLHASLRALIDGLGAATFNAAALNVDVASPHPLLGAGWAGDADANGDGRPAGSELSGGAAAAPRARALPLEELWVPAAFAPGRPPVVARLVSRGKLDNAASDYGGLEVFGGASIGHTDPYAVAAALDAQLAALP